MIIIEEFRIGNYILANNVLCKICCTKNDHESMQGKLVGFRNNNVCEYEAQHRRLECVKITDQLLLDLGSVFTFLFPRCGSKKTEKKLFHELDNDYFPLDFSHQPIVRNMLYLHQLQNLFFIIQGRKSYASASIHKAPQ